MELEMDDLVEGGFDENRRLSEAEDCDFPGSTQYPQDGQLEDHVDGITPEYLNDDQIVPELELQSNSKPAVTCASFVVGYYTKSFIILCISNGWSPKFRRSRIR